MNRWNRVIVITLVGLAVDGYCQSATFPDADWKLATATEHSEWSAKKLAEIEQYIVAIGSSSTMVVQHGVIVASWGNMASKSNLHSCRKSLLNALIGIAVAQGTINLNDSLDSLGVDDIEPSLTPAERQATVRDLLQARSGVYHPSVYETKGMRELRPPRSSHSPGTFWYYNNWDFNVLGYIYERATSQRIFDAFYQQIAQPIGMQDFTAQDGVYVASSETRFPAYLFNMSARDLARFAMLYLHGGRWKNTQLVPEDWVKASTRPYSDTTSGGYGYLWWTADSASNTKRDIVFPKGSFWAEGHLGQYAVVVPSLDLIIVTLLDERLTKRSIQKRQMAYLVGMVVTAAPR